MGRCADDVLKRAGIKRLSLFITAPFHDRVDRKMQLTGMDEKSVTSLIRKTDKQRKSYYNFYADGSWGKPYNFDLCINSSAWGIEHTAKALAVLVRQTEGVFEKKGEKVMWNRLYDITMQTPIGNRYGSMNVTVNQNHVDGILTILKKATPFDGSICEDGNCRISGQLITLMRTIPYDAVGQITKSSLWLILKGEQETFEVSGSVSDSNVSAPKEQAL